MFFHQLFACSDICLACNICPPLSHGLCKACYRELPWLSNYCCKCGLPLPTQIGVCQRCILQPPAFQQVLCACLYKPPLSDFILAYKDQGKHRYRRLLVQLLVDSWQQQGGTTPDTFIIVPSSPAKLRQRGFNPCLQIAKLLSKRLDISLNTNCLTRHGDNHAQHHSNRKQRQVNVAEAFSSSGRNNLGNVVLIDDVVTTGATSRAVAEVLQKRVKSICLWTIASTPSPD